MKLTYVRIHPKEGKEFLGILEAHENRFVCECLGFRMVIMHAYLESCFMRLGDMKMTPLLHFHLRHTVKVGTIETKDIQVHLMPHDFKKGKLSVEDPLNFEKYEESLRGLQKFRMYQKSGGTSDTNESYFRKLKATADLDYIVKYKQAWNNSRNEDLKNFVHEVQQRPQSCDSVLHIHFHALEELEFSGDVSTPFALTYGALVLLKKVPFSVILVQDIEIVNLARLEHERIDMTVVFKDYERDVLEIRSIPLEFLTGIKHRLHFGAVKYYVNEVSKDWNMLLKDIRQSLKEFIDSGGWGSPKLDIEDPLTLTYYRYSDSDSNSDSDSEW